MDHRQPERSQKLNRRLEVRTGADKEEHLAGEGKRESKPRIFGNQHTGAVLSTIDKTPTHNTRDEIIFPNSHTSPVLRSKSHEQLSQFPKRKGWERHQREAPQNSH